MIGGNFTSYDNVPRNYIARINSDGSLDKTFNPSLGPDNVVDCIALQADGKVFIGGSFHQVGGLTRNLVARLDTTGTVDTTFVPPVLGGGFAGEIFAISIQPDGKPIVAGCFGYYDGNSLASDVLRLNEDGSRDANFAVDGGGSSGTAYAIAIQPDGKILVAGAFQNYTKCPKGQRRSNQPNGTLDNSFGLVGRGFAGDMRAIALQPDGKVVIGGSSFTINNDLGHLYDLARVTTDGLIDNTFSCTLSAALFPAVNALELRGDGSILFGGYFTNVNGAARNHITLVSGTGEVEPTFDPGDGPVGGPGEPVLAVTSQVDGRVFIAGNFTSFDGIPRNNIARLLAPVAPTQLGNISTRLNVGTGDNVLIGGFIVTGSVAKQVITRATALRSPSRVLSQTRFSISMTPLERPSRQITIGKTALTNKQSSTP